MLQSRNTVLQLGLYIYFLYLFIYYFFFFGVHGTSFIDLEEKETRTHFL